MYANPHTEWFNPHRQYAFLRKYENELLLIAANFDESDTQVRLNIPSHAFDYFKLPEFNDVEGTDLLTDTTTSFTLSPEIPAMLNLPGYSGVIYKFIL